MAFSIDIYLALGFLKVFEAVLEKGTASRIPVVATTCLLFHSSRVAIQWVRHNFDCLYVVSSNGVCFDT